MKYLAWRVLRAVAILAVSAFLAWLGWAVIQHQSSTAFEAAITLWIVALIHWVWWPQVRKS